MEEMNDQNLILLGVDIKKVFDDFHTEEVLKDEVNEN